MIYIIASIIALIGSASFWYVYSLETMNQVVALVLACSFLGVGIIFLFLGNTLKMRKQILDLRKQIEVWGDTTYHISAAGDRAFEELPIGIIAYDSNKLVKWANNYAKKNFQMKLDDNPVNMISDDLETLIDSQEQTCLVTIEDKVFEFIHNKDIRVFYLFDVTERETLQTKYRNRTMALGIIVVDNLDESLKRYDLEGKTTISAKILGELSTWASNFDAYLQTIDDDRMSIICSLNNLEQMIEDKFSILNTVREISRDSHIRTTISIGIAAYDIEANELGKLAENAVELAEKRGGDQVVVNIQGEKIQYIGGQSSALEKNTLVAARMQTNALKDAVDSASNVLIMAHNAADCDALGAMIGAYRLIESFKSKKDVRVVIETDKLDVTANKIFQMLEEADSEFIDVVIDSKRAESILNMKTLMVVCDTQSPKIAMFPELVEAASHLAIIDHHRVGDIDFVNVDMSYVETYSSSTVELISEMFIFSTDVKVTPLEACVMLAGIIVDTSNFSLRTGTRTFEAAASLKELGADVIKVRQMLRDDIGSEQEVAKALLNVEIFYNHFAVYVIENQIKSDRTLLAKISEKLLEIDGVDASFTICRISEDEIGVSSRSLEAVNVQMIMEEMGGGGHLQAAATQIKGQTLAEVKDALLKILKRDYDIEGEEKMKVILTADVKGKGKKNDVIEVNNGYGNYLLTNNLGVIANEQNLKNLAESQKQAEIDAINRRNLLEKLKSEIQDKSVTIYIKQGSDGRLFGHVTTKLICDEFELQNGIKLDKRKLELPNDINSIGIYQANINLDKDIVASFQVNVLGC